MKKIIYAILTTSLLLCMFAQCVHADAVADWYPEESDSSYDVLVSAPDGGVNLRYGPGVEYDKVLSDMIPNGVVLHVTREAQATNGNYWGYTTYNGVNGWIALTQVSVVENQSTYSSDLYQGGSPVDYDVSVTAPDGGVNLRYGPGTEYEIRISMIPNDVTLHIFAETAASTGNTWGYTNYNGTDGWIALSQVTTIAAPPVAAVPTATPIPTPTAVAAPTTTAAPIAAPVTAAPSKVPTTTIAPTPAPKEEGITLSYSTITKMLVVLCVILILAFTAVMILYIRRKH